MDTLILTGWGWKDYAVAAALALRHFKKADVAGCSTRRLPEFLREVSGYKEIVILGVGLTGDVDVLAKALKALNRKEVKVSWISALELPENCPEEVRENLIVRVAGDDGITAAVSEVYNLPYDDIARYIACRTKDSKAYEMLLDAAMYVYRNYQDTNAYSNAIRHLANNDPESKWTPSENNLIEHFKRYGNRELAGKSKVIGDLLDKINRIAPKDKARVLIYGESGTGKETVALLLHNKSPRHNEPFIAFNCASVTSNLLESRFFGYEKGAFTGATERKLGIFEQANGGTLFLDEIGELPPETQGLLLRVLEGGRFTRLGEKEEVEVDVRLITATNRDLAAMVRDGKFREDLFHRLNVIQLRVAPLREHLNDIADIANSYWLKRHHRRLEAEQIAALQAYDYPGNVRELFNILERAFVLDETDFGQIIAEHRAMQASLKPENELTYPDNLEAMTRMHIRKIYNQCGNNLSKTAEVLGTARNTVRKYLQQEIKNG